MIQSKPAGNITSTGTLLYFTILHIRQDKDAQFFIKALNVGWTHLKMGLIIYLPSSFQLEDIF